MLEHQAGQSLGPLEVAPGPVQGIGRAAQQDRLGLEAHASTTQVSFDPPPWEEFTT